MRTATALRASQLNWGVRLHSTLHNRTNHGYSESSTGERARGDVCSIGSQDCAKAETSKARQVSETGEGANTARASIGRSAAAKDPRAVAPGRPRPARCARRWAG